MNDKELKTIILESIAKVMAEEVARRLELMGKSMTDGLSISNVNAERTHTPRVFALFTGSKISAKEAVEQLAALKKNGAYVDLFFSKGAEMVMDPSETIELISPDRVLESKDFVPEEISKKYDCLILPTMTINTAAKLASCICDSYVTRTILSGMFLGTPVVAAIDGCCPENEVRKALGHSFNDALKSKLSGNLETIRSFGIKLTACNRLCQSVIKRLAGSDFKPYASPHTSSLKSCEKRIRGRIIGEGTIKENVEYNTLVLEKGARLTQLAREAAERFNIEIVYER